MSNTTTALLLPVQVQTNFCAQVQIPAVSEVNSLSRQQLLYMITNSTICSQPKRAAQLAGLRSPARFASTTERFPALRRAFLAADSSQGSNPAAVARKFGAGTRMKVCCAA